MSVDERRNTEADEEAIECQSPSLKSCATRLDAVEQQVAELARKLEKGELSFADRDTIEAAKTEVSAICVGLESIERVGGQS